MTPTTRNKFITWATKVDVIPSDPVAGGAMGVNITREDVKALAAFLKEEK